MIWSTERAWEWYRAQEWIRGYCGYPSNCVNRIALRQEYGHKAVFDQPEREFALAKETGLNAVRTVIQFEVRQKQHEGVPALCGTGKSATSGIAKRDTDGWRKVRK